MRYTATGIKSKRPNFCTSFPPLIAAIPPEEIALSEIAFKF